ncbi:MAG: hypothetical protein U9O94_01845, partial [Nanoarchaeota archaeon]|nr:hypothetical protein [Nanoarchaeota archaeon]
MNIRKKINWDVFTKAEKKQILVCYDSGNWQDLCCLPEVNIDTQEKEKEIERIVLDSRGTDLGNESEVRQELEQFWGENKIIETPKDEEEWQKKIDEEEAEKKA